LESNQPNKASNNSGVKLVFFAISIGDRNRQLNVWKRVRTGSGSDPAIVTPSLPLQVLTFRLKYRGIAEETFKQT
jgi:hypothetical protein